MPDYHGDSALSSAVHAEHAAPHAAGGHNGIVPVACLASVEKLNAPTMVQTMVLVKCIQTFKHLNLLQYNNTIL